MNDALLLHDLTEKVRAGCELLSRRHPAWAFVVTPECLNLTHPRCCVLGQLYSTYYRGKTALGLQTGGADAYGFEVRYGSEHKAVRYQILTNLWRDAVRMQRLIPREPEVTDDTPSPAG